MRLRRTLLGLAAAAGLTVAAALPARAGVMLPVGDIDLTGFLDFVFAKSGVGFLDPSYYIGGPSDAPTGLDTWFSPPTAVGATGLTYEYGIAGEGTGTMVVTYRLTNTTAQTWANLRFFADVALTGSYVPGVHWPAPGPGDPDQFGVDDFFSGNLFDDISNANQLDGTNQCGVGPCEEEAALQWNLASLAPGLIWEVQVGLSDDGTVLGSRHLTAAVASDEAQVLTLSGTAQVVPLPPSALLLASGLAGLAGAARKRRRGR